MTIVFTCYRCGEESDLNNCLIEGILDSIKCPHCGRKLYLSLPLKALIGNRNN